MYPHHMLCNWIIALQSIINMLNGIEDKPNQHHRHTTQGCKDINQKKPQQLYYSLFMNSKWNKPKLPHHYRQRKLCGKRHNQQLHYQNNRQNIQKNIYIKFKMKINKGLLMFIINYYFYNYNLFNNNLRTCKNSCLYII